MGLSRRRLALHMSLLRSFDHGGNRNYKYDAPTELAASEPLPTQPPNAALPRQRCAARHSPMTFLLAERFRLAILRVRMKASLHGSSGMNRTFGGCSRTRYREQPQLARLNHCSAENGD